MSQNPFPFILPRHPIGEPLPTAGEEFAFQIRPCVSVPGKTDGLYACLPLSGGGYEWVPWLGAFDPFVITNLHVLGDVDIDDDLNVDGDAVIDGGITLAGLAGIGTRPVVTDASGNLSAGSSSVPGTIDLLDGNVSAATAVSDVDFTPAAAWTVSEPTAGHGRVAPIFGSSANTFAEGNHTQALATISDVTASAAEVNVLDGITASTTELNYVDGVTSAIQTQLGNKQPLDSDLTTIASLTPTTNNFMVASGSAWASRTPTQALAHLGLDADIATLALPASTTISAFGASLIDDAAASNARTTLGLVIGTDVQAQDAFLSDIAALSSPVSDRILYYNAGTGEILFAQLGARLTLGSGVMNVVLDAKLEDIAALGSPVTDRLVYWNAGTSELLFAQLDSIFTLSGGILDLDTTFFDERIRDTMGTALVAGNNIDITVSDGSDTITIAVETLVAADLSDVTATAAELNILDGVTATAAELNALDGITATVTELNYTDGVTSAIQTQLNAKAPTASPSFTGTVTLPTGLTGVLRADSGVVSTDADVTDLVSAASDTASGKVELATTAETTTGTDATRAVTPGGLHDMTSLTGAAWFLDEDAMTSDSATKTVSQQSVKAYADTKQPLDADLTAVAALSGDGLAVRTGANTWALRDIVAGTGISVSNGDGVSGNPTVAVNASQISLADLGNVTESGLADDDYLRYNSATTEWENAIFPTFVNQTFVDQWVSIDSDGTAGSSTGQFADARGVFVDGSGNIFVCDEDNHRVQKFNSSFVHQLTIGASGSGNGQFNGPRQVAVDGSGNIFVADAGNGRIQKFNSSGVYQAKVSTLLNTASGVCLDGSGNVYASSYTSGNGTSNVQKLSNALSNISFGVNFPSNNYAEQCCFDGTYVWVALRGFKRIAYITAATMGGANFIGVPGLGPGQFDSPYAVAYDANSQHLFVTDLTRNRVMEMETNGVLVREFGTTGSGLGQFNNPSGVALNAAGTLCYVADDTNENVQTFEVQNVQITVSEVGFTQDFDVNEIDTGVVRVGLNSKPLEWLNNTAISSIDAIADGQSLVYRDGFWVNELPDLTSSQFSNIDFGHLSDVVITSPATGQVPIYNATTQQWENKHQVIGIYQDSNYTGSNVNTAQKIFNESANGACTLAASTTYKMKGLIHLHTTGTTSHSLGILFAASGGLTFTSFSYSLITGVPPASGEFNTAIHNTWTTSNTELLATSAVASASHHTLWIEGVIRTNAGGTMTPQYRWSAAPGVAGVTLDGSYLELVPIGGSTVTTIGTWT